MRWPPLSRIATARRLSTASVRLVAEMMQPQRSRFELAITSDDDLACLTPANSRITQEVIRKSACGLWSVAAGAYCRRARPPRRRWPPMPTPLVLDTPVASVLAAEDPTGGGAPAKRARRPVRRIREGPIASCPGSGDRAPTVGPDPTRAPVSLAGAHDPEKEGGRLAPAHRFQHRAPQSGVLTSCRPCRPCRACRRRRRCPSRGRRRRSPRW